MVGSAGLECVEVVVGEGVEVVEEVGWAAGIAGERERVVGVMGWSRGC